MPNDVLNDAPLPGDKQVPGVECGSEFGGAFRNNS